MFFRPADGTATIYNQIHTPPLAIWNILNSACTIGIFIVLHLCHKVWKEMVSVDTMFTVNKGSSTCPFYGSLGLTKPFHAHYFIITIKIQSGGSEDAS